jgi:MFS family permease
MATDVAADRPGRGLRHNTNWHRLLLGQGVSLVGDSVFNITILLWVATVVAAHQTWAPVAASGVLIAAAIPVLIVAPIAGVYVDRWDRRLTMRLADLARAVIIALLLLEAATAKHWPVASQLAVIYTCVLLESVAAQFFNPSRLAILRAAIPKEDRSRAFGISGAVANTASVIGPPLAAPLLFGVGVQWALLIDVISFLASYACVTAVKLPAADRQPARELQGFWREFGEGLSFFRRNKELTVLCGAVVIFMFGVGAVNALNVFFVPENLHTSARWLGVLSSALSIGAIVGALIAARLAGWLGEQRVFSYGLIATGLIIAVYSRLGMLAPAVGVYALAGIPIAAVNVVVSPIMLRITPEHMIGRVATIMNPLVYLASISSMAVAGVLASSVLRNLHVVVAGITFGRIDTIFGCGALLMIAAGCWSVRPLRNQAAPAPESAIVADDRTVSP